MPAEIERLKAEGNHWAHLLLRQPACPECGEREVREVPFGQGWICDCCGASELHGPARVAALSPVLPTVEPPLPQFDHPAPPASYRRSFDQTAHILLTNAHA